MSRRYMVRRCGKEMLFERLDVARAVAESEPAPDCDEEAVVYRRIEETARSDDGDSFRVVGWRSI